MSQHKELCKQANQLGMDLERHMRQERLNGHLSPTDSAILQRVSSFLLKTIPTALNSGTTDNKTQGAQ